MVKGKIPLHHVWLNWLELAQYRFLFKKVIFGKMKEGARRSILRVLPWHVIGSEYLEGTTEEIEVVMCDWPGLRNEKGYPLPRDFIKNVL
jgi:hypothetical protein